MGDALNLPPSKKQVSPSPGLVIPTFFPGEKGRFFTGQDRFEPRRLFRREAKGGRSAREAPHDPNADLIRPQSLARIALPGFRVAT